MKNINCLPTKTGYLSAVLIALALYMPTASFGDKTDATIMNWEQAVDFAINTFENCEPEVADSGLIGKLSALQSNLQQIRQRQGELKGLEIRLEGLPANSAKTKAADKAVKSFKRALDEEIKKTEEIDGDFLKKLAKLHDETLNKVLKTVRNMHDKVMKEVEATDKSMKKSQETAMALVSAHQHALNSSDTYVKSTMFNVEPIETWFEGAEKIATHRAGYSKEAVAKMAKADSDSEVKIQSVDKELLSPAAIEQQQAIAGEINQGRAG